MPNKYYVGIPTNVIKDYCAQSFFTRLSECANKIDCVVHVVDNSIDGGEFWNWIYDFLDTKLEVPFQVDRILPVLDWPKDDPMSRSKLATKNINHSFLRLINSFLKNKEFTHFISLEADVFPNSPDAFVRLIGRMNFLEKTHELTEYGIGGIYYKSNSVHLTEWFDKKFQGIVQCGYEKNPDILPWGIAGFPRQFIERYDKVGNWEDFSNAYKTSPGSFFDALCNLKMKKDNIYRLIDLGLKCSHLHDTDGTRGELNIQKQLDMARKTTEEGGL
jgi:hypothetical protein